LWIVTVTTVADIQQNSSFYMFLKQTGVGEWVRLGFLFGYYKGGCHDSLSAVSDALPVTSVTLPLTPVTLSSKQLTKKQRAPRRSART
jgi:hypothetical protein